MDEGNIRQVLAALGVSRVHKSKGWVNCSCPLAPWTHEAGHDKSPSFGVKIDEHGVSGYKCHSCKHSGRLSSLVRQMERLSGEAFPGLAIQADMAEAYIDHGEYDDYDIPEPPPEPLNEAAYSDIYQPAAEVPEAVAYLTSRGVDEETTTKLDLRFDHKEQRVLFPVRGPDKRLYGYSGRTILHPDNYPVYQNGGKFPKVRDYFGLPKRSMLLGMDRVTPDRPVLVVEGLMGYASLVAQGVETIMQPVALLGSELTDEKADLLIDANQPVYLLTDNDEAGDICLYGRPDGQGGHMGDGAISKLFDHLPVYAPLWPEGMDDPDQLSLDDVKTMRLESPMLLYPD